MYSKSVDSTQFLFSTPWTPWCIIYSCFPWKYLECFPKQFLFCITDIIVCMRFCMGSILQRSTNAVVNILENILVEDSLHSAWQTQTKKKYARVKGYNLASAYSNVCREEKRVHRVSIQPGLNLIASCDSIGFCVKPIRFDSNRF